jgi:predicted transcriptional regulator of viral defense system
MNSAADYIENLQVNGRLAFTTEEIVGALGKSVPAVRAQLHRLKEKGRIADPFRGFHVVVPAKYRRLGCLPADQFIPQLMAHLSQPYYVALLSAAAYHGAAHQKPQVFQVMVPKARLGLECGGVRVDFVARRDMSDTPVSGGAQHPGGRHPPRQRRRHWSWSAIPSAAATSTTSRR